ncbi:hypothetical protein H0H92_010505 [Tricholoma furcatifolium]|nr:hypothetical protein H0H92_010505 [Tricholoma furcatifolium]
MSYKENLTMGSNISAISVKPEPRETVIAPLKRSDSQNQESDSITAKSTAVKEEQTEGARAFLQRGTPISAYDKINATSSSQRRAVAKSEDVVMEDATVSALQPKCTFFTVYDSSKDIAYTPENALKEGIGMVKSIRSSLKDLQLGSRLRQDVWMRELERKSTIDADVSFLTEAEWREELAILLTDLVDEDGNLKRSNDIKSDAGVHAVYPTISQEQLIRMTADQIISRDPSIAKILGTTKNIIAPDSKTFAKEIAKYIDSKDQKRGDKKKDKKDKKAKDKKSLMDKVREASGTSKSKDKKDDAEAPALWPLIRQVNVRCKSAALSTGAILVDLPGVADANAARNNIAKDYMKKADCIWILAPITRAVDDKTARDGNYDDHAITFIASKCDDVSCSEVIRALHLEDDTTLEEIEARLETYDDESDTFKQTKSSAAKTAKAIESELKTLRKVKDEYEEHLQALKDGKSFTPRLTAKSGSAGKAATSTSRKRKNVRSGKKGTRKRHRGSDSDSEQSEESDVDSYIDVDSDSDASDRDTEDEKSSDDESKDSDAESDEDTDQDEEQDDEEVTEDSLEVKIKDTKESIKSARERLSEARKLKKDASDALANLKKNIAKTQREKNAFCSLKRSEFSRDVLKEDFRVGLKDLDDAAAEERDPDNFDPTQNIRDYEAIDLPVFTCSSRDYVRLKGQVKGDGEPTCFANAQDTGIPDLQRWCHQLTVSSRERAARNFLSQLKAFATSVKSYVQGIGEVTVADREDLRQKWESSGLLDGNREDSDSDSDSDDDDPYAAMFGGLIDHLDHPLYSMVKPKPAPKVDEYGRLIGIAPRLALDFSKLVDKCITDLQELFKDGLEEKCKTGAANAAAAAVATSDEFAASMHWGTYRATLRRHGSWRRDLNVELVTPFTRNIAHSWSKVFESDLFGPFEAASTASISKLLKDVEDSAAPGLKDRTKMQGEQCLEEARVALKKTMEVVRETMNNEQKEVSRCMAPHVQTQLVDGYDRAMEERGRGSVARQKAVFHEYISNCKDEIFDDGADVLMERLTMAAKAVGDALDASLDPLAQKVEVNLSVLWEGTRDDPAQLRAREDIMTLVKTILQHIDFWMAARETMLAMKKESQLVD